MSYQIKVNHTFGWKVSHLWEANLQIKLSSKLETFSLVWYTWPCFLTGPSLCHWPFSCRCCCLMEPRAIGHQLLLCLQTEYSASNRQISCCSIPASLFLGVLLSLEVFFIVWRFSLNTGDAFAISVPIHFDSQTGHSSYLHMRVNAESLIKLMLESLIKRDLW